jgi:hypothetical protein
MIRNNNVAYMQKERFCQLSCVGDKLDLGMCNLVQRQDRA